MAYRAYRMLTEFSQGLSLRGFSGIQWPILTTCEAARHPLSSPALGSTTLSFDISALTS